MITSDDGSLYDYEIQVKSIMVEMDSEEHMYRLQSDDGYQHQNIYVKINEKNMNKVIEFVKSIPWYDINDLHEVIYSLGGWIESNEMNLIEW